MPKKRVKYSDIYSSCTLCAKPSVRYTEAGLCASCVSHRQKFPQWTPTSVVSKVDFEIFKCYDQNGNELPVKTEITWAGLCGHSISTSCHKEKIKSKRNGYPWHCSSCAISKSWEKDGYRLSHKKALKVAHNTIETKQKHSRASRRNFENPQFVARHREYAGYKSAKRTMYKNIVFRSTWEVAIAQLLDQSNITWEYETQSFKLVTVNSRIYIPDFYLPAYNLFFEIKGWYTELGKQKFEAFINEYQKKAVLIDKAMYTALREKIFTIESVINNACNPSETCA